MASLELTQRVLLQVCMCVHRLVHKPIYTSNNGKSRRGPHIAKGWLFITYKKSLPIPLLSDVPAEENKQNGTAK